MLIEREAPGGQAGMSSRIENYLGFQAPLHLIAKREIFQAGEIIRVPHDAFFEKDEAGNAQSDTGQIARAPA